MQSKIPGTWRDGKGRVDWRWGGTRSGKRQSVTFSDVADVINAYEILDSVGRKITSDEMYQRILGEEVVISDEAPSKVPTFREMFEPFIKSRPRRAPSTNKSYRTHFNCELDKAFGDMRVDKIEQDDVAEFIRYLDKVKNTSSTVTRYYATLHAAMEYAVRKGYMPRNPANADHLGFDRKKARSFDVINPAAKKRMYLTYAEYDLIAEAADDYARPLIEVLVGSGMRISEAVALDIQDVDWANNRIHVFKQVVNVDDDEANEIKPMTGVPGYAATKNRQIRWIGLEDDVMLWLKRAIGDRAAGTTPGDAPIFLSPEGKKWDYDNFLKRHWNPAIATAMRCEEHPPPLPPKPSRGPRRNWRTDEVSSCLCITRLHRRPTPHQLRHTHATWLLSEGWQIAQVSRRLGHSSIRVTDETYSDFMLDTDSAKIKSFGLARSAARARRETEKNGTPTV